MDEAERRRRWLLELINEVSRLEEQIKWLRARLLDELDREIELARAKKEKEP